MAEMKMGASCSHHLWRREAGDAGDAGPVASRVPCLRAAGEGGMADQRGRSWRPAIRGADPDRPEFAGWWQRGRGGGSAGGEWWRERSDSQAGLAGAVAEG